MNRDLDHTWELVKDHVHGESLLDGEDLTEQELRERWESRLADEEN